MEWRDSSIYFKFIVDFAIIAKIVGEKKERRSFFDRINDQCIKSPTLCTYHWWYK